MRTKEFKETKCLNEIVETLKKEGNTIDEMSFQKIINESGDTELFIYPLNVEIKNTLLVIIKTEDGYKYKTTKTKMAPDEFLVQLKNKMEQEKSEKVVAESTESTTGPTAESAAESSEDKVPLENSSPKNNDSPEDISHEDTVNETQY